MSGDARTTGTSNTVAAVTPTEADGERIGKTLTSNTVVVAMPAQAGGEIIGTTGTSNPVVAAIPAQANRETIHTGTTGTSNPVAATMSAQADGETIDAGTTETSNPVAAAMPARDDGERIEAGTAGTSNPVATARPAQADGERIETTRISNPVAVVTPAQSSGEILDTGTVVTSNPVTAAAPAQVVISMARPPFRAVNGDLFTPWSVPIGPYHFGICSPRWEREKERVAEETLNSLGNGRRQQLAQEVRQLEKNVTDCYGGWTNMDSDKLVSMLLTDGCYVLNFFVHYNGLPDFRPPRGEQNTVMRDIMYLLENQLPMIVLDRIHRFLVDDSSVVLDEVEDRVRNLLKQDRYIKGEYKPRHVQAAPSHLLQLVHTYFQPQLEEHTSASLDSVEQPEMGQQTSATGNDVQDRKEGMDNKRHRVGRWRRATEYSRYGNVQLKRRKFEDGAESILDVRLEGNTLLIPRLRIDSSTWTILRNLMALEQQAGTGGGGSPVTAYCLFMSQLASKVEDIELLKRKKIVEHYWGNDEEVAQGFADLCKKVMLDVHDVHKNYLCHIRDLLHQRCESLWHNCLGSFRHSHCGDSMRILAFVTAGLLFAFQLIQVILAGFSLREQGK